MVQRLEVKEEEELVVRESEKPVEQVLLGHSRSILPLRNHPRIVLRLDSSHPGNRLLLQHSRPDSSYRHSSPAAVAAVRMAVVLVEIDPAAPAGMAVAAWQSCPPAGPTLETPGERASLPRRMGRRKVCPSSPSRFRRMRPPLRVDVSSCEKTKHSPNFIVCAKCIVTGGAAKSIHPTTRKGK